MAKPAPLPTADGVAVGKGDGVDGVNHGLPLPTAILCQLPGSRQIQAVGKSCFADCRKFQLAKGPLCRVSKKNSWQRKLQSAKSQFPVVASNGCSRVEYRFKNLWPSRISSRLGWSARMRRRAIMNSMNDIASCPTMYTTVGHSRCPDIVSTTYNIEM